MRREAWEFDAAGVGCCIAWTSISRRISSWASSAPAAPARATLLNALAGHTRPKAGTLAFDGDHDAWSRRDQFRAQLGHVPQDDVIYPALTVDENLGFAAELRLGSSAAAEESRKAIGQAIEAVGLAEHRTKLARVLSGGQRKRLSVAVELLRRPRLLLLDEPTSGLDPASEANLMEQLRYIAKRGTTVVCTTHAMDNLRLFDRIIVLGVHDGCGRLAYMGRPDALLERFTCRSHADLFERLENGCFTPLGEAASIEDDAPLADSLGLRKSGVDSRARRPASNAE